MSPFKLCVWLSLVAACSSSAKDGTIDVVSPDLDETDTDTDTDADTDSDTDTDADADTDTTGETGDSGDLPYVGGSAITRPTDRGWRLVVPDLDDAEDGAPSPRAGAQRGQIELPDRR